MPGKATERRGMFLVGLAVAILALVGYLVFGWRFGEGGGSTSMAIGVLVALLAVTWTAYSYLSD